MPILDRTQLNSSDKLHLLAKSSVCQAYGDISQLSTEFNVSRKVIYKSKKDALDILSAALTPLYLQGSLVFHQDHSLVQA